MGKTTEDIILEELREFRSQVQPWMQLTGERVMALETQCGNCSADNEDLEQRVRSVEKWYWQVAGISSFVSLCVGWALLYLTGHLNK